MKPGKYFPEITLALLCLAIQVLLKQLPLTVIRCIINGALFLYGCLRLEVITQKTIKR